MVVSRDVEQRAHLARLLTGSGYRVVIAESAAHACRIGFDGFELAIVAPDGLGPAGNGLVQDLRAAIGRVLLVARPTASASGTLINCMSRTKPDCSPG